MQTGSTQNYKNSKGKSASAKKNDGHLTDTIAKGAVGIAVTAGVVAAGVILSKEENRKKIGKGLNKGLDAIKDFGYSVADNTGAAYQSIEGTVTDQPVKKLKKIASSTLKKGKKK